jgi:hypothetical protein
MQHLLFLAAVVLLAIPVAAPAQSVKVAYDHSVNFTRFKTYAWVKGLPAGNPQIHKLIVDRIDRQLQSKGLQEVNGAADLHVTYYASLDENINTSAVEYMKNSDWKKWGSHDQVYGPKMVALPKAGMLLDLIDASANRLVWQGHAMDAYTPNVARAKKRVMKVVEKLFKSFPPPPK